MKDRARAYYRRQIADRDSLLRDARMALVALAKLASDTPQFFNPIEIAEAQRIRDCVLRTHGLVIPVFDVAGKERKK